MAKRKQIKMPQEMIVYQMDTLEDGTVIYAATQEVDGVPEEMHGEKVGVYTLNKVYDFRVRRELK
jgi:hypothetical protein